MPPTRQSDLDRALSHLLGDVVAVAPGFYGWQAYSTWKVVSEASLLRALALYDTPPEPGYKRVFTTGLEMIEMPPWWRPDHTETFCCEQCKRTTDVIGAGDVGCAHPHRIGVGFRAITVDLSTGHIVPAR